MSKQLQELAKLIRYFILVSTTEAGSGHPTSSLSATDLMATLFFGGFFKFDLKNTNNPNNDRLIFSKGHASPLFYSLYTAAGVVSEEQLKTLRRFDSPLEGHPTLRFKYTEAATGSLGQGLGVGVGMALNGKYSDKLPYKTYVLLGDSEMAEGSVWEAAEIASFYKLDNLIAILDVNRLGQRGETMYGHNMDIYSKRLSAFGWEVIKIDGHNLEQIKKAFKKALGVKSKPTVIIAKTLKGKGISFIENNDNWHGKALKKEELQKALLELGRINNKIRGKILLPKKIFPKRQPSSKIKAPIYSPTDLVSTRKAYGNALSRIYPKFPDIVVLDAEVSNSTFAEIFRKNYPKNYFEMFIAEQNMVSAATGFSRRGKIPFVSTFSAFLSRAHDQIRMGQYSGANIKFVGSHSGVSIGEDGASQMGLEDIAMFRSILNSVVLYPSDAYSTEKLVEEAAKFRGFVYIRTTRMDTPLLYSKEDKFKIGGSKILKESKSDKVTVVGAGVTLYEALKAYEELKKEKVSIRIIDLYSIKPLDINTLKKALLETKAIITVEDHHLEGGLGEGVSSALSQERGKIFHLAVEKMPKSGKPQQLLDYENISSSAIIRKVKNILT